MMIFDAPVAIAFQVIVSTTQVKTKKKKIESKCILANGQISLMMKSRLTTHIKADKVQVRGRIFASLAAKLLEVHGADSITSSRWLGGDKRSGNRRSRLSVEPMSGS